MFKKIIIVTLILMCSVITAEAFDISFQWDQTKEKDIVKGVHIYLKRDDGTYLRVHSVRGTTDHTTATGFTEVNREYCFRATFYTADGTESSMSNEACKTYGEVDGGDTDTPIRIPKAPTNLTITDEVN